MHLRVRSVNCADMFQHMVPMLVAYSADRRISPASFDRDLDKFTDIQRYNP